MQKMKYKVLAADDEYWSRENLRSLISWEDYAIKFLDPACDGEEVLERIKEEKPDIILTDINMPFLDGLELLKKLQTEYPQIITIAVSGYDDFEKVKGVFVSGGLDYLLKPVGKEELVRILTKALGILEERETLRRNTETNRQKEHKLSSFMEDSEYSALLSGKLYGQFQAQPHVSSTGEFSGMAALMVKFYNIAEIAEKFDHDSLQMSLDIKTKLRKLTDGDPDAIIFNNCNKMSEFLIFTSPRTKSLQIFAEKILKEFPLDDYGPVSVILHEQTGSLDDIGNIYRDMIAVLVTRPFTYTHCILSCPEGESTSACQTVGKNISHRIEEELYHFLNTSQKNETRKLIFQTCDFRNCDNGSWSCLDVKQYIRRITGILYRYVQEQQPELTAQADKVLFTGMIDEFYDYCYGELEYRSLKFETEVLDMGNYQGNAVVNYTDYEVPYTRIIEHKHFEFGTQPKTVITREYPAAWEKGKEPYYPVNDPKNSELFDKYERRALEEKNVIFGGRLGMYRYMDMDQVIEEALSLAETELTYEEP